MPSKSCTLDSFHRETSCRSHPAVFACKITSAERECNVTYQTHRVAHHALHTFALPYIATLTRRSFNMQLSAAEQNCAQPFAACQTFFVLLICTQVCACTGECENECALCDLYLSVTQLDTVILLGGSLHSGFKASHLIPEALCFTPFGLVAPKCLHAQQQL